MNEYWGGAGSGSPIFVFTGAEGGDIEAMYNYGDYGHVIEMASR